MLVIVAKISSNAQVVNITEINYKSDPSTDASDWVELHNTTATAINLSGWTLQDADPMSALFVFPAAASLPANGYAVVYRDIIRFGSIHPGVGNTFGPMGFTFGKGGDTITLKNASGVQVAQVIYDNAVPWPKVAEGFGRTIELKNPDATSGFNVGTNWQGSCMGGSPGLPPQSCNDAIIYSEINYNSDTLYNHGEYVELFNTSAATINLTGWALRDSRDTVTNVYYFPSGTLITNNSRLVVSNDLVAFAAFHPTIANVVGPMPFSFSNGGEVIRLFDAAGVLRFSVYYNDTLAWTTDVDGTGKTLELVATTGNMNEGSNWKAGCILGSPGVAYDPLCPLGVNELSLPELQLASTLITNELTIYNSNSNSIISVVDVKGNVVHRQAAQGATTLNIDTAAWAQGLYIVHVTGFAMAKVVK